MLANMSAAYYCVGPQLCIWVFSNDSVDQNKVRYALDPKESQVIMHKFAQEVTAVHVLGEKNALSVRRS